MKYEEIEEIKSYCMEKPCVYESRPFGPDPICYRIAGKIFCQLSDHADWYKVTLKTNPEAAEFYRMAYPGVVVRGYHCPPVQQPYWNTLDLYQIDKNVVFQMIDQAYDEVVHQLTRKEQARLEVKSRFQFKKENDSKNTLAIYNNDTRVGSGEYGFYDDETVEIKEVFLEPEYRGLGLAKDLLLRLEADARIRGFRYAIAGMDTVPEAAALLFKKSGYKIIENYGPYIKKQKTQCMKKKL